MLFGVLMKKSCNKKLKKLADASPIRASSIPILVCDEELYVCTGSIGFEQLYKDVLSMLSVHSLLPANDIRRLRNDELCTFRCRFLHNDEYISVVAVKTEAAKERCTVFVFELMSEPGPSDGAWYIKDACEAVGVEVHELLNVGHADAARLMQRAKQLSRLCSVIAGSDAVREGYTPVSVTVFERLSPFIVGCEEIMALAGISISIGAESAELIKTDISKAYFDILMSTLIMCAASLSSDGAVDISCKIKKGGCDGAEITVGFITDHGFAAGVSGMEVLGTAVPQLALELAALSDTASRLGIRLGCRVVGDRITAFCGLPVSNADDQNMNVPSQTCDRSPAKIISDMCALFCTAV